MIMEKDRATVEAIHPPVAVAPDSRWERVMAPIMFTLGFLYLLVVAGLIHRAHELGVHNLEITIMERLLVVLWPIFVGEAMIGLLRRCPEVGFWKAASRVLLVVLLPPMRMSWIHPAKNQIWLPRLGWKSPGKPLLKLLEKVFGGPMLVFAFLILPVLVLEYVQADRAKTIPGFGLALDLGISIIWVAFAVEFAIKVSASPNNLVYLKERWLDLAIVGLPALEFVLMRWVDAMALARLFRLSRALGPQQLSQMGRIYRLRGLMMKAWHAVLIFEVIARLAGNSPPKRLKRIQAQIEVLEEQLAELRAQESVVMKQIASTKSGNPDASPSESGETASLQSV